MNKIKLTVILAALALAGCGGGDEADTAVECWKWTHHSSQATAACEPIEDTLEKKQ